MSTFEWPWQYNFPPFFTLQPNAETRKKQIDAWCQLVLSYHQNYKQYSLNVQDACQSPLFLNKSIDRKVKPELLRFILDELQRRGNLEWTDKFINYLII